MAKAINWPKEFYDEIIQEKTNLPKIALRLTSLYFDNAYYTNGEIVDIRVDHKITRKAKILNEMKLLKIKDLTQDEIKKYSKKLQTKENIIQFLALNYNEKVNENTEVTLIAYENLETENEYKDDDPHFL